MCILWDLFGIKLTKFSFPKIPARHTGGRPDGRRVQWSADRTGQPMCTGDMHKASLRAVDQLKAPHSRVLAGQPGG